MKIAVISTDNKSVDLHLGKGVSAYIYFFKQEFEFLEHRVIDIDVNLKHQGSKVLEVLSDCDVIIAQDFGFKSKVNADSKNITLYKFDGSVDDALKDFINWYEVMNS